jgi:hypothetical protein
VLSIVERSVAIPVAARAPPSRVVLEVTNEATQGVIDKLKDQLPDGFDQLIEAGSRGRLPHPIIDRHPQR